MRAILIGLLFFLSTRAFAQPPDERCSNGNVCSQTWKFEAACNGLDMWDRWSVSGASATNKPFIRPWLNRPIRVVGYELLKLPGDSWTWWFKSWLSLDAWKAWTRSWHVDPRDNWFMLGSTIQPDALISLGPSETHAKLMFLPFGQMWPSETDATQINLVTDASGHAKSASGHLIDLHGTCFSGKPTVFVTIYYVVP